MMRSALHANFSAQPPPVANYLRPTLAGEGVGGAAAGIMVSHLPNFPLTAEVRCAVPRRFGTTRLTSLGDSC